MKSALAFHSAVLVTFQCLCISVRGTEESPVISQGATQLPRRMHTPMKDMPRVTVGYVNADICGRDNRSLQAAVDYVARLGGGIVEVGEGEYLMRDSLHLRSFVKVRGIKGKTVLRKADGASSALEIDGDYGEEQITVSNPAGFQVGDGVTVWDSNAGGFHTTVATITGRNGNTFSISKPLNADCMVQDKAKAATVFPVISGYDIEGVTVEGLTIEGNKSNNVHLNGCRGGGIFLYRAFGTHIENCEVRNYNGDGISFQQSNDVVVRGCVSEENTSLGIHPGSGSQRPTVQNCTARRNGEDGLFLCWRVKNGLFEQNLLEGNGRYGISIGHKDTDNLLRKNEVRSNHGDGVYFRNEALGMAGHRNRLEENVIENNGDTEPVAGIRVRGQTQDVVLKNNVIRDTRANGAQAVGIQIDEGVGPLTTDANSIDACTKIVDHRSEPTTASAR